MSNDQIITTVEIDITKQKLLISTQFASFIRTIKVVVDDGDGYRYETTELQNMYRAPVGDSGMCLRFCKSVDRAILDRSSIIIRDVLRAVIDDGLVYNALLPKIKNRTLYIK